MTNDIQKIRELLKNINNDDEIDEIHEILDRLDGSVFAKNPRVNGIAEKAAKNGVVQEINVINEMDHYTQAGGGGGFVDSGPVRVDVSFAVDPREIYDD